MCFSLMKHMTNDQKSNHADRPKFREIDRELNYSSWLRNQEAERDLVEHVFVQNTEVKIPLYAKCGMARTAKRLQEESLTFQREAVDVTVNSLEMEGGVWLAKTWTKSCIRTLIAGFKRGSKVGD